jgi:hypothetical protein
MTRFLPKIIIHLSLLVACYAVITPSVRAQDLSLVVSPPRVDLEGKPGDTLQQTIKVTNGSTDKSLILKAFAIDFVVLDDAGTPVKVSESASGRYLASPWFTLENSELTLAPKETTQMVVLINVPKDALPGGHYAGVFFEPVESKGLNKTVSYTSTQVGSLFGITVPGDIKYDALIKSFSVDAPLFEFGPIDFTATIENQSDTHIRPSSSITVHDMIGRKVVDLPLSEINIFPFTARSISGTWDTVWGLGRYTATLTSTYGPGLVASRTLYFWIMPYRLIAAIVIVLLVIVAAFILIKRHIEHREDHRDDEIDELKRKIVEMENKQR